MRLNNFHKAIEATPPEIRKQVKRDLDTMDNINLQSEFDDLKIDLSLKESELDDLNKSYAELKKRASILTSQVKIRDTELIVLQKRIALLDEVIRFISREKAKVKAARNFAWIVAAALLVFELLKK